MIKPVLQALLLAEHVYADRETGKKVICGTFNRIDFHPEQAPRAEQSRREHQPQRHAVSSREVSQAGFPTIFISLTNLHGRVSLELRYVDLKTQQVLLSTQLREVECADPLRTIDVIVPMPIPPIPHEGVYAFGGCVE